MTENQANPSLAQLLEQGVKALSVRTPWAWLIVAGYKDVENRVWNTGYRGPLLIHAGYRMEPHGYEVAQRLGIQAPKQPDRGGIIGVVDLVDICDDSDSPWYASNHYAWKLSNPRSLPFTPCKGKLGLFIPEV